MIGLVFEVNMYESALFFMIYSGKVHIILCDWNRESNFVVSQLSVQEQSYAGTYNYMHFKLRYHLYILAMFHIPCLVVNGNILDSIKY